MYKNIYLKFCDLVHMAVKGKVDTYCGKPARTRCFLRNFAKFAGKHLCQSLFLNKVERLAQTVLKKRLWHRCFSVNSAKFLTFSNFSKISNF